MKRTFIKNLLVLLVIVALSVSCLVFAACNENQTPPPTAQDVEISVVPSQNSVSYGETVVMVVAVSGTDNKAVTWTTSHPELVAVSESNVVSVLQNVTVDTVVTLTATSVADTTKSISTSITVKGFVPVEVELTASATTVGFGETVTLTAAVTGSSNTAVTWTTSHPEVVAVSAEGVLSVLKSVVADTVVTVTATSVADNTKSDSITVTVKENFVPVELELTASADSVAFGDTITLTATVTGTDNKAVTWTVSDPELVAVTAEGVLSVIRDTTVDRYVTVTATSVANTDKSKSIGILVLAPVVEGQVGELTSEMLKELGSDAIRVDGVLTDYYTDFNMSVNSTVNKYDMTVVMQNGLWQGSWNHQNDPANTLTDTYRKGENGNVKDENGQVGHAIEKMIISKDNEVQAVQVKNYISIPAIWESQHLWNHLGDLSIDKFTYDAENEVYAYNPDLSSMDDLYLLTYLSYCLTPMLSDTLFEVYLVVEDGEITKMIAQTEILYYGSDTQEDADAMSYTTIELTFSEVGTAVVKLPEAYSAPENADKLEAALAKMAATDNYSFFVKDVTTSAPQGDAGDYEIESVAGAEDEYSSTTAKNFVSAVGTVGMRGWVTSTDVLFATTGKYSYSMDGKDYHTEYSGYRQNADNSVDYFEYDYKQNALVGKRKNHGTLADILPTFNFSANVFEFDNSVSKDGKTLYTFTVRETAITRDLAMEVCAYSYADSGEPSSSSRFTIVVDGEGNLVSTSFPYSLSGVYYGICTTTYSDVGTTEIPAGTFVGYVPRVVATSWADCEVMYYKPDFTSNSSTTENAQVAIEHLYGDAAADLPSPELFYQVFGDTMSGPFYDDKVVDTDAEGNNVYHGWISITISSTEYDENVRITNYEELMAELQSKLEALGYVVSAANTDMSGGESGQANRYLCMVKGDIQIVIENNHTKYFWIDFYHLGDWSLNR